MWALAPSLLAGGEAIGPDYPALVMASQPVHYWRLNDGGFTSAHNMTLGGNGTYDTAPNTRSYPVGGPVVNGGYMLTTAAVTRTGMATGISTNYTSECTIEFFFYAEASQPDASPTLVTKRQYYASATNLFPITVNWDTVNTRVQFQLDSGNDYNADTTIYSGTLSTARWYHVAAVYRASGLCELYIDGVQVAQTTINYTIGAPTSTWEIGRSSEYSGGVGESSFNGRIAEVALYNRALPGVEFVRHLGGKPKKDAYRKKVVSQLYNVWGSSATEVVELYDKRWSPGGGATISSNRTRFGHSSWSFDGTGDYIQAEPFPEHAFGTGDFTVEGWFYSTSIAAQQTLFDFRPAESNGAYLLVSVKTTGAVMVYVSTAERIVSPANMFYVNAWHHVAVQRKSGTTYLLVDGMLCGSWADTTNYLVGSVYGLRVGQSAFAAAPENLVGNADGIRITKGVARHTLPTVPGALAYDLSASTLLRFEGANNSTTMTDESGKSWTANGNAKLSTALSKFGSSSLLLDGNGDYVSASHASLAMGTNDFAVEGWFYRTSSATTQTLFDFRTGGAVSATGWTLYWYHTGDNLDMYSNVSLLSSGPSMPLNAWTHIAVVRRSGYIHLFVNGELKRVFANSTNFTDAVCRIGSAGADGFVGYVSDFRITRLFGRYVGAHAHYARTPHYDSSFDSVVALLPFNLPAASTNMLDVTGKTWTAAGNAQGSASQGRFGGYSLVLDGNGDYIYSADNADWDLGTGDFTVEGWFYWSVLPSNNVHTLLGNYDNAITNDRKGWTLQYRTDGSNRIRFGHGDTALLDATVTLSTGTWYHIAAVRRSGVLYIMLDGSILGSVANTTDITGSAKTMQVGALHDQQGAGWIQFFNGYVDSIRITKGVARYLQPVLFALPSLSDFPDHTFSLITIEGATATDVGYGGRTWTNPTLSNTVAKFGTYSMYNASLTASAGTTLDGDFSIDGWFFLTSRTNYNGFFVFGNESSGRINLGTRNSTGLLAYDIYGGGAEPDLSATAVPLNEWCHLAFVRRGTELSGWINGKKMGATTQSGVLGNSNTWYFSSASNAYAECFRLIKGRALFGPPTAPFPLTKGP
jgi:hypothetical protein